METMLIGMYLLCSLVYLVQEFDKDLLLEPFTLVYFVNHAHEPFMALRFGLFESAFYVDVLCTEDFLHSCFGLGILFAVVVIENLSLFLCCIGQCNVDVPGALVVENICANCEEEKAC
jgi:hypothetical protein